MKLLPKSEIVKQKAVEQRQNIDEGLKLTRRIDRLREVVVEEDAALEKFRRETLENIQAETTAAASKRDELLGEVAELETRRKEALEPICALWEAVNQAKEEAEQDKKDIEATLESVRQKKEAQELYVRDARQNLEDAAVKNERARDLLQEADEKEKQARETLLNAQVVENAALEMNQRITKELIHREDTLVNREKSATIWEANLSEREAEIVKEWRLLNDRKAAFERTLKRLNK